MSDLRWVGRHSRALCFSFGAAALGLLGNLSSAGAQELPESPGTLLVQAHTAPPAPDPGAETSPGGNAPGSGQSSSSTQASVGSKASATSPAPASLQPCGRRKPEGTPPAGAPVPARSKEDVPCTEENPLQPIIGSKDLPQMTPGQKGYLAVRDVIDPFNIITIVGYAGITVAANPRTAYGPGMRGFGRLTGYGMVEDMQGEFFGTFLIPALAHQDPRYYRMPGRPFPRRLLNALSHTWVTRHDDGSRMPNYATLLTYPISAELTNLYVPGVAVDGPATAKRIGLGLATDPVGQIVAEFLPDVAKRIHIRFIFVQQILQQVAQGSTGGPVMTQ